MVPQERMTLVTSSRRSIGMMPDVSFRYKRLGLIAACLTCLVLGEISYKQEDYRVALFMYALGALAASISLAIGVLFWLRAKKRGM